MEHIQHSFQRYETKFVLNPQQFEKIFLILSDKMAKDEHGEYTICSIYYDTDDYELIRRSLDKPAYKEKFRIRCYEASDQNGMVFAEIKKKYKGITYKRRVEGSLREIENFISQKEPLKDDMQIQKELWSFLDMYKPSPKVLISYDRKAFAGIQEKDLRVTFDQNIRYRTDDLKLSSGDYGKLVLQDNLIVMEIKTPYAIPLWLAGILSENGIYSSHFSKYGNCYLFDILPNIHLTKGEDIHV